MKDMHFQPPYQGMGKLRTAKEKSHFMRFTRSIHKIVEIQYE